MTQGQHAHFSIFDLANKDAQAYQTVSNAYGEELRRRREREADQP